MNKITPFIISTMLLAGSAATSAATPSEGSPRGGRELTETQLRTIKAVHPWIGEESGNHSARLKTPSLSGKRNVRAVNPSGSTIQGYRTSKSYTEPPSGWYDLATDGTETLMWEYVDPDWADDGTTDPPAFPFAVGFYRNGTMYGFHAHTLLNWIVWGYGSFSTTDGTITSMKTFGEDMDDTDFSTYVISCAYNEEKDQVYAYTLNSTASGYMLQIVDPETWEFRVVKSSVNIEDICIGFCYNSEDGKLYGMTPDARFVTMDADNGSLTELKKYNLTVTTSVEGMTYSPLDKKFYFVFTVGAYGEDSSTLYSIDADTYDLTEVNVLRNAIQYRILMCPDKGKSGQTPLAPEIVGVDFPGGSSSGTVTLKMPETSFDGSPLVGHLTAKVFVDSEEKATAQAMPGAVAEIPVSGIAEGSRRFSFIVEYVGEQSAEVDRTVYVGFDTPVAPSEVTLTEGNVTWTAPAAGVNEGYIDSANLRYNVYLNGRKLNGTPVAGNSYSFTMPDAPYALYTAQVEAVSHDKVSEQGASNSIKFGNPNELPYTMAPSKSDFDLVKFVPSPQSNEYTSWRSDWVYGQEDSYFFSTYTSGYNSESEWFFLPPVKARGNGSLIEVTLEVAAGSDESDENLEVAFGNAQTPEAMVTAERWKGISSGSWTTYKARFYADTDCGYVGIKTVKHPEGYKLKVRNIKVAVSPISASIPAAVTDLEAVPFAQGKLKTKVSFSLPTTTMAGNALGGKVTAYVRTSAGTATVAGAPGSRQSVDIDAIQGYDKLTVTTGDENDGMTALLKIYTGTDVPSSLTDINVSHSDDYQGFTLSWETPQTGVNGGYIDPSKVTYALCKYNEEEWAWEVTEQLGSATSYEYTPSPSESLRMVELGILAQNEQGNSGNLRTVTVNCGKPLFLPLDAIPGEDYYTTELYANMLAEAPTEEYTASWGYVPEISPTFVPVKPIDGTGGYVVGGKNGTRARAVMAPFSTEGVASAGMEIQMWTATPQDSIAVYAEASGIPCRFIGRYSCQSPGAWEKHRFHLPEEFMGKKWVSVKVDAEIKSDEGSVAFSRYTFKTFVPHDLAVTALNAPYFPALGSEVTVTSRIANIGTTQVSLPQPVLTVSKDGNELATLKMTCTSGSAQVIDELDELEFAAGWTPGPDVDGDVELKVSIVNDDADQENNLLTRIATVSKGNLPIVTDLTGAADENGAQLTWSDPVISDSAESFENYPSFYFGDNLGRLKTVCRDGLETMCFGNLSFPYDINPKAWQVFDENEMTIRFLNAGILSGYMTAAEGNRFVAAFVPYTEFLLADLTSDRWIISPELKPGSDFSFMLTSGVSLKEENLQVMYSTTDDNPDSFLPLDNITLLTAEWRKYTYTLPEGALYFALRYCGNTERGFFVLADDFRYDAADEVYGSLAGYDIYKDGVRVEENANVRGRWNDPAFNGSKAVYSLIPVYRKDGALVRGLMSNEVTIDLTGVSDVTAEAGNVIGTKGALLLEGLAGEKVSVYSVDGLLLRVVSVESDSYCVEMPQGAYIVRIPGGAVKTMVR